MYLSAPLFCTRCGYQNQPGYQFCSNCGAPLSASAGAPVPVAPPFAYPYYAPYPDYEYTKQIDRTKTGILLLLIGTLISWIPFIGGIGILLVFIGAVFVILGRKAFGGVHSRNVVIAIVVFFVGLIAWFALIVASTLASLSTTSFTGGPLTPAQLAALGSAVVTDTLISIVTFAAVLGISSVLFTYALQNQNGKILLWAAYVAHVALGIAIFLVVSPLIPNAAARAAAGSTYNPAPFDALQAQISAYQILSVIPALLYTGANYIAWSRISRGEIPARPGAAAAPPPGMPPYYPPPSPPAPPTPPQAPPSGPAPPINPQ